MRNNNLLKIVLGILFAAAALFLLWLGCRYLWGQGRLAALFGWVAAWLTWGGLLRYTVRYYKHFW